MELGPETAEPQQPEVRIRTLYGAAYWTYSIRMMQELVDDESVDLIITSPPFGLVRKKEYGNADSDDYLNWFMPFAAQFARILKPQGSLVIDIGGVWQPGTPTKGTYIPVYTNVLLPNRCRCVALMLTDSQRINDNPSGALGGI